MKNFQSKVVVVTGAGSGIGQALAFALGKEGARLAINDRDTQALAETATRLQQNGVSMLSSAFDVSDKDAVFAFADQVFGHFGQVDVVVNNAGLGLGNYPFAEFDLEHFERIMQVNFYGVLYGSRAFVPHLLKQPEAALVNVSSVYGLAGIAEGTAYCASKFAVNGLNQCLIQEFRDSSLRVHSVHPGGINTNITRNAIDYQPKFDLFHKRFLKLSPEYAADVIIRGIRNKKARILIGADAHRLDFVVRLAPVFGTRLVNKILDKTRREVAAGWKE
ncbi:MAG: SDR family NAD(P)-dependent oxidoreductase [Bacteroidetes bacterium]|nr:SDR family NAD(P)-dependent oxidoreductase [Bacteroidota bacterium]